MNQIDHIDHEFNVTLIQGSVKNAMAHVSAKSRDLWQVPIDQLRILDKFNVRVKDAAYEAHIRSLANSIKSSGFYQDEPLGGYVAREGNEQVIYVHAGHCRLEGAKLARSEGAELHTLPVVVAPAGTSLEDLTVALVQTNSGKPLSPFEVAVVCKRLIGYGWDEATVADRLGMTQAYVSSLLAIMAAPLQIREMIQSGRVTVSTALDALRQHGADAIDVLMKAETNAKAAGKTKITATHLPGRKLESFIKRSGPKLFEAVQVIRNDPGYDTLSPDTRDTLEALLSDIASFERRL